MKKLSIIHILLIMVIFYSCNKEDYYISDITSSERAIIDAQVKNQVGTPVITRTSEVSSVKFKVFGKLEDLKNLAPVFAVSSNATIEPKSGVSVDFTQNPDHTVIYKVTSQSGETREWKIIVELFNNPYEGQWSIKNFTMKWDDWNGWGLSGSAEVALKMFSVTDGLDDKISFKILEGIDASGSFYGAYERTPGADGKFGTYISPVGTDWSDKFGQLPNGKGKYFINPDNSISIVLDGTTKRINSKGSKTSDGSAMIYSLNAPQIWTIDWNDYYGTENQLKMAYDIWYDLAKD